VDSLGNLAGHMRGRMFDLGRALKHSPEFNLSEIVRTPRGRPTEPLPAAKNFSPGRGENGRSASKPGIKGYYERCSQIIPHSPYPSSSN